MALTYVLIAEDRPTTLARRVTDMLKDDKWELWGSPVISSVVDTGGDYPTVIWTYAQAMLSVEEMA